MSRGKKTRLWFPLTRRTSRTSDSELTVHRHHRDSLVLSTLTPLLKTEPTRKCFRLIGGVLVERTVSEVEPDLKGNLMGVSVPARSTGGSKKVCLIRYDEVGGGKTRSDRGF